MSAFRYLNRARRWSADAQVASPSDLVLVDDDYSKSPIAGKPVPVVFGTRFVPGAVVAWGTLGRHPYYYYLHFHPQLGISPNPTYFGNYEVREQDGKVVEMVLLFMRMVLTVGRVDRLSAWEVGGSPVSIASLGIPGLIPNPSTVDATDYIRALNYSRLNRRYVVTAADSDLYGQTGLGFPHFRGYYSNFSRMSEFWFTERFSFPIATLDGNIQYRGLSTLTFSQFNFGKFPPDEFRVAAQRIEYLTEQLPATVDTGEQYKPQWQPLYRDGSGRSLSTVSLIPTAPSKKYYLVILYDNLTTAQKQTLASLLKTLVYDSDTVFQVAYIRGVTSLSSNSTSTTRIVQGFLNYQTFSAELDRYASSTTYNNRFPVFSYRQGTVQNPIPSSGAVFVRTYADTISRLSVANNRIDSTVIIAMNDLMSYESGASRTQYTNSVKTFLLEMNLLKYPSDRFDTSVDSINDPLNTQQRYDAVTNYQPEMRLLIYPYRDERTGNLNRPTSPYTYTQRAMSASTFALRTPGTAATTIAIALDDRPYVALNQLDSTNRGYNMFVSTFQTTSFASIFQTGMPFGYSMNPVHALREALTDPNWGEGNPENRIDDDAFYYAAVICKEEGLDYCYVHDTLGSANSLIKDITDYIDGIVYYEPQTDKITLKLIREDYRVEDLPSFNEDNISWVRGYRRQHSNELVNSVTVNYHDAAKGEATSVTIHDLSGDEQGGVISANLTYNGCATRRAAQYVARRELAALSRSAFSLNALIYSTRHIGLGDPILISYADLNISNVVMRVMRINYSDGLSGGIEVQLIQDVFSPTLVGSTIGFQPLPEFANVPSFTNVSRVSVKFLEAGFDDLVGAGATSPYPSGARYIKIGRGSDPNFTNVTVEDENNTEQQILISIGKLVNPIDHLTTNPTTQNLVIYVYFQGQLTTQTLLRIDDEIMEFSQATLLNTPLKETSMWQLTITKRAVRDTVAKPHARDADVWFLDDLWVDNTVWDGSSFALSVSHSGITDRELVTPDIGFVGRANRPPPPTLVRVNNVYRPNLWADGDIAVTFLPRTYFGDTGIQTTFVLLKHGTTEIHRIAHQIPGGPRTEFTDTITSATISSAISMQEAELTLSVYSEMGGINSWQSWDFVIDWASRDRTGERQGWNYDFGRNWGSGDTSQRGWGYDFDLSYGF